jgi:putative ABC transport system permease protein
MSTHMYRLLLRLLPRDRREHYGEQMAMTFDELSHRRPEPLAFTWLWMREVAGLVRFAVREWSSRVGAWIDRAVPGFGGHRPPISSELHWAWRGVRSRGWRGVLVIGLLAFALAANTIIFAAADSFVFDRVPYPEASRLVEIGQAAVFGWSNFVPPDAAPVWRSFTDLFSAFHTYQAHGAGTYLKSGEGPRFVADASVSPGLLDMLGARPIAGRLFVHDDAHAPPATLAIVGEEIARQEFGGPQRAVGQTLRVGRAMTTIIGVLPEAFRFPSGAERVWTPLDMATVPKNTGSQVLAKMAPGMTLEALTVAVKSRAAAVQSHLSSTWDSRATTEARSILPAQVDPRMRRIFLLLCAAAGCLLLVACANVVNLELTMALARARTYAIAIALGASGGTLLRTALLEGALTLAAAAALGAALASQGIAFLAWTLPPVMTSALAHQLAFDRRAFVFTAGITTASWLVTSLPVAVVSLRTNVLDSLKRDGRTLSTSRGGTRVRQALTIAEVAMTVVLLAGALLSARSYAALLAIPKGFDTARVVSLTVRQAPDSREADRDLQARLLAALKSRADVVNATVVGASPPGSGGAIAGNLQIVGRPERMGIVTLGLYDIDLDYFRTMRLPLRRGREFEAADPPGAVIVDEGFATRYWPKGDALGARFNTGGAGWSGASEFDIIGIAAHMRTQRDSVSAASDEFFPVYKRLGNYAPLSYAVRLADPSTVGALTSMIRTLAPGARVRTEFLHDRYANMFANEMLAASIMSAFGVFAFLVAIAGIYGVMAFLVAGRTREIGIRMALGADGGSISRLVLGSSARLVMVGAVFGIMGAFAVARWAGSLLFGVTPTDPLTYVSVTAAVVATALVATWQPARQAAHVDPSRLLRD